MNHTSLLFPIAYLPSISYMANFLKAENVILEQHEHYPKQTIRNRCYIYSPNGKQLLTIPIKHNNPDHTPIREIKISYDSNWQKIHWRSLEAAYRSSPYFEFYEDSLRPFYEKKYDLLFEFNQNLFDLILKFLKEEKKYSLTTEYEKTSNIKDLRENLNLELLNFPEYYQVFKNKYGFLPDLSIVDLLFNEGPQSKAYLENLLSK